MNYIKVKKGESTNILKEVLPSWAITKENLFNKNDIFGVVLGDKRLDKYPFCCFYEKFDIDMCFIYSEEKVEMVEERYVDLVNFLLEKKLKEKKSEKRKIFEITKGDLVELKSGSMLMTVKEINEEDVLCEYYDIKKNSFITFETKKCVLKLVD